MVLQKVVVNTSLKESRKKFRDMVTFLGNFGTREIHFVHVVSKVSPQQRLKVEKKIERVLRIVENMGASAQIHIRSGHIPTNINEVAEEEQADYIALCWMPKSPFRNALFGNVDSDILRLSNLPVFIYDQNLFHSGTDRESEDLESVLYATDLKDSDPAILPYLVDSRFKANKLCILHVGDRAPDPVTEGKRKQQVLASLAHLAQECSHAYNSVEYVETIGMITKQIVRQATALEADLIVIGKSEKSGPINQVIGSTAEILPHVARCNIFIIPVVCRLTTASNKTRAFYNETA